MAQVRRIELALVAAIGGLLIGVGCHGRRRGRPLDAGHAPASAPARSELHAGVEPQSLGPPIALSSADLAEAQAIAAKAETMGVADGVPLVDFGDDEAVRKDARLLPYLMRSSTDPKVLVGALTVLARLVTTDPKLDLTPAEEPILAGLISSGEPHIAAAASAAAETLLKGDATIEALLARVCRDSVQPVVRAAACNSFAERSDDLYSDRAALVVLFDALTDEAPLVLLRVMDALDTALDPALRPANALDRVLALTSHREPLVRAKAIDILFNFATEEDAKAEVVRRVKAEGLRLVADDAPIVRGYAGSRLPGLRDNWDAIDGLAPLLDDKADVAGSLAYATLDLDPGADNKDTWSLSTSASYGGQVGQLVLGALVGKADDAPPGHELKPTKEDDFAQTKKDFVAWWQKNRDALERARDGG